MARTQDLGAKGPSGVVTAGPWSGRDSFVAETAVTLDRLTAKIERLERREEALTKRVAELVEHAQQASRFQALAESLRNSRDYKLDEILRQVRDARARVDVLEGPRTEFNTLVHKSFVAVDGKLAELSAALSPGAGPPRRFRLGNVAVGVLAATVGVVLAGQVL